MRLRCRLRDLRGERSLRALERETGINRGTLSLIERGRMLPRDRDVRVLEAAYGAPVERWYWPIGIEADR